MQPAQPITPPVMSRPTPPPVQYAGFWKRFAAFLIDSILLGCVSFLVILPILGILGLGIGMSAATEEPDVAAGFIVALLGAYFFATVAIAVVSWLYYALMESSEKMATLGKMALSIKVTDLNGNRISFGRATGRYFAKILSGMILYIGYIMAAFTERKQALHDIIASCLVVVK